MWVQSLGWEEPLEEETATCSSILAGKSHGQRSLVGYSLEGREESDMNEHLSLHAGRGLSLYQSTSTPAWHLAGRWSFPSDP